MGYYTRMDGDIKITPPITYKEFVQAGYDLGTKEYGNWLPLKDGYHEFGFNIETRNEVTDTGRLQVIWAEWISPADDDTKAYGWKKAFDVLLVDFGANHQFTGVVMCYGEEGGDVWRIVWRDNKPVQEQPELRWPEGDLTKLLRR